MNFAAHVLVAGTVAETPTTGLLLGAAAPDLTRMAGLPTATDGRADLSAGIAVHHRTDAAFHGLDWFRDHNRRLVADLTARGVRRGPARGAAHVLIELLLDGALLAQDRHAATFATAWSALAGPDPVALAMVDPPDRAPWADFLGQLTVRLEPAAYGDPRYAADRTAGTLARRPRLAMTDDEVLVLRAAAVGMRSTVVSDADDVLRSVALVVSVRTRTRT